MTTWRIVRWSRELGRGAIQGAHGDPLEFDGNRADVDDFEMGELVHVDLERAGDSFKVLRIRPDLPRFSAPEPTGVQSPDLDAGVALRAQGALQHLVVPEI